MGEDVSGLYVGETCISGICFTQRLNYFCGFFGRTGTGTVCGWATDLGTPQLLGPVCLIETDGTRSGGPFTGGVAFCLFGASTSPLGIDVRVEGTTAWSAKRPTSERSSERP